jgi:hypothetical protein
MTWSDLAVMFYLCEGKQGKVLVFLFISFRQNRRTWAKNYSHPPNSSHEQRHRL